MRIRCFGAVASAALLAMSAASALAQAKPTAVPEIDAGAGVAVVAALGASVAIMWERRRRR